ncbi:MAG TPA: zinc ribbon domain-containing protein [Chthonomonadaceae bacterium]|nr:zinc ribbon domain-containing protein [Chthonomonadaceae bacterium]
MKRILAWAGLTLLGAAITVTSQALPVGDGGQEQAAQAETGVTCPKCHHKNSAGAHFCAQCGTVLHADACPHCGASIAPGDKFCSQCGFELAKAKSGDTRETPADDKSDKKPEDDGKGGKKSEGDGKDQPAASPAPEVIENGGAQTKMRIIAFMDTSFHATNGVSNVVGAPTGKNSAFQLGEFDLFMTSRLSDKMNVLAETVIAPDTSANTYGIEVERLLLNYRVNDYLNLGFGRYHTHVGYYSTAYHHGTVLQTAATRPFLFKFEDDGGPLPIHNVGVAADGALPSGKLGLRYVFEVGNGRTSSSLDANPVQNFNTDTSDKAINLALIAHPDNVPGLEYGVSAYHDRLVPTGAPSIDEWIYTGHVVYQNPNFEWLNEAVLIQHTPKGTGSFLTPGFYSQIARQFGLWRPYVRFEYINSPLDEPFRPDIGLMYGPHIGVKYDINAYANMKFEFAHTARNTGSPIDEWFTTLGFTF